MQNLHPLPKVKKHQNSDQLAKKLVALDFKSIELVEFEILFRLNEP